MPCPSCTSNEGSPAPATLRSDFLLKPELLRAVVDCGFEHPSEVQYECIPQAILGMDVLCQAKSGMGKTAVFVLSTLHQLEAKEESVGALVLCHTRELAIQICNEFERFSRYLPDTKTKVFYVGVPVAEHKRILKSECPHIIVGTPGRVLQLVREKELATKGIKHFILDECDQMLQALDIRRDVQEIFKNTPHEKQVMMFSATLSEEMRTVCKKFMQDPMEIYVDTGGGKGKGGGEGNGKGGGKGHGKGGGKGHGKGKGGGGSSSSGWP